MFVVYEELEPLPLAHMEHGLHVQAERKQRTEEQPEAAGQVKGLSQLESEDNRGEGRERKKRGKGRCLRVVVERGNVAVTLA